MARSEARLSVEIWSDPDFLALSPSAQRQYMFLLSQADLAHTGVIALRERRWSRSAAGLTAADVERDLKELEGARFVVIDWDAEELLVRSFMRGDKVYRQPQVLAVAATQLTLVSSLPLRVALRVELERIATLDMAAGSRPLVESMIAALEETRSYPKSGDLRVIAGGEGGGHPTEHPAQIPGQQALGDWGVVTTVTTDSPKPHSSIPNPQSSRPKRAAKPTPPTDPEANPDFMAWWHIYPNPQKRPVTYQSWLKAVAKFDGDDPVALLLEATKNFADAMRRTGQQQRFIPHSATWLNGEQWRDPLPQVDRATGTNGHRPYTNPADSSGYYGEL